MIYLISQDWINTSNNHAGIKYLCNQLSLKYPLEYKSLVIPDYSGPKSSCNKVRKIIRIIMQRILHKYKEIQILKYLKKNVQNGDIVFIMEYLDKGYEMYSFARIIKMLFPGIKLFCMAHLVPAKLNYMFPSECSLHRWLSPVDKLFTLGSSLTSYLRDRGVDGNKLVTTFHYLDDYYIKKGKIQSHYPPKVIAMGNQVRNIDLLKQVVTKNNNFDFIICQGVEDMSDIFRNNKNVTLIPFVEEPILKELMNKSDISLNVMEDTIGSNVIVTSLGMGLAMICSDVGSIRDYCDSSNTIFCDNNNPDSFSQALHLYETEPILQSFREASRKGIERLSIESFHNVIQTEANLIA